VSEYKHTLHLPQTDFPMRGNLPQREPEMLKRWQELNIYQQLREQRAGQDTFILHDGPPYANGDIHIGHAVNKILKDFIVKAKSMNGLDSPYIPGWDCHGLPIELQVEKNLGKKQVSPREFRDACREYARQQIEKQSKDFQRLGVMGDWARPYLTMDFKTEADIVRALGRIIAAGHVDKGFKPVHWCSECGSALAEAEVEYEDKTSPAIDVRFQVVDEAEVSKRFQIAACPQVSIVIWTTTPWTLPANQAVALHPELEYVLIAHQQEGVTEHLILAEALLNSCLQRYQIENYQIVARCVGQDLEHLQLKHPFYAREVPVILGDHVTTEAGTGAVHTAPGHGLEDYIVGLRYHLPIDNPVGGDGKFLPHTEIFAGEPVFKANDHVIEVLQAHRKLLHHEKIRHSYPHCWRHKTPIIFRATPQWFISMEKHQLRQHALEAIQTVDWTPEWGEQRIVGMIENRPDWCISRQRNWGVPITVFVHKETGALHPQTLELIEKVAQKIEKIGIDAWFELQPAELLGDDAQHYDKASDTLDVWFDSGVTHATVLETRDELCVPADLYLEGSDQHRGWFQSSLLTSVAMRHGKAPYSGVLTHGFTVDAKGRKMSKSLGNVIAPQDVIKNSGADILRLWVAATDYRGEITVSNEILTRIAEAYRRIRNTSRFLLANLAGFDPATDRVSRENMLALDRWAVDKAYHLQHEIIKAYDSYNFHVVYQKVHHFCTVEMGSLYLDIIKDRQYTCQKDSVARRSAQTALFHIIEALSRWLTPILSFTADEIWQYLPGARGQSVLLETWYNGLFPLDENSAVAASTWDKVWIIREAVSKELEKLRAAEVIGAGLEAEAHLYCDHHTVELLSVMQNELRFVLITSYSHLHLAEQRPEDAVNYDGFWVKVRRCEHKKCIRCWHLREDVGTNAEHPELCGRCVENVAGAGEVRLFA
jgi:isoleucyl-tRNA synthetase